MGVFDGVVDIYQTYEVEIIFRDKLMGGVPKDPDIVSGWLRSKAGITREHELFQATLRTLRELGVEIKDDATYEEMVEASKGLAAQKQTNGFYRDANGLYIPERYVKSMLKEVTNILFAGDRWGRTKKGPKSFLAERCFVEPLRISLGRSEPDGVMLFIGHTSGPRGPQSNLTYYEYVEEATIRFLVEFVKGDDLDYLTWARLWTLAQDNGLGALRSQGMGRFEVTRWQSTTTRLSRSTNGVVAADAADLVGVA